MRKIITTTAVAVLAVLGIAGTAGAASIASDPNLGIIRQPATSFVQPNDRSQIVHQNLSYDERVHVRCVAEGQKVDGSTNWYRIGVDGRMGFVPSSKVYTPVKPPSC